MLSLWFGEKLGLRKPKLTGKAPTDLVPSLPRGDASQFFLQLQEHGGGRGEPTL